MILALLIVNESTISEVWDDVGHPAVDDMPLRAFTPLHDIDDF